MKALRWGLRIVPALILFQTLFFKFTGAPESVALFTKLTESVTGSAGLEAPVRIGVGIVELVAGVLLLVPRASVWGALLAAASMAGAILGHLTILGIDIGDGGILFVMAVIVLAASLALLWLLRGSLPFPAETHRDSQPP
jgi:uncharacterized membrane protein YphA (DoxX/SURF4 family)